MRAVAVADTLGGIGSAVCALHCLAGPVLLLSGPILPAVLMSDASFHRDMLWCVVPTSTAAFTLGCWRHKDRPTLLVGAAGLVALVLAAATLHHALGEVGEKLVTLLGAALLGAAHVRNFRLCRRDACAHEATAPNGSCRASP